eukprot:m.71721 g.71721  ORF g.71721 m.71721 type:complete len:657 (+) comp8733_c0_seq1:224-2194(+)
MDVVDLQAILDAKVAKGAISPDERQVIEERARAGTEDIDDDDPLHYAEIDTGTLPRRPARMPGPADTVEYTDVTPSRQATLREHHRGSGEPTADDDTYADAAEGASDDDGAAHHGNHGNHATPSPCGSSVSMYDNVDHSTGGVLHLMDDSTVFHVDGRPDVLSPELPTRDAILAMFVQSSVADMYSDVEQIGKGATAIVYRGVEKKTGTTVALKKFKTIMQPEMENSRGALTDNADDLADILTEVRIMKRCSNDNVLRLRDAVVESSPTGYTFWVSLDYCFGSCFELFKILKRPLAEPEIAAVTCQVLNGLEYLHSNHVMHRDIKCGNILVTLSGTAVLADFGVSIDMSDIPDERCGTFVGSPYWIAPEVVLAMEDGTYSYPADIWSLGITVIEMSATEPPNFKMHAMSVLYNIPEGPPPRLPEDGPFSDALRDFVSQCLVLDPNDRATAATLALHKALALTRRPGEGSVSLVLADLLAEALEARERRDEVSANARALGAELQRTATGLDDDAQPKRPTSTVVSHRTGAAKVLRTHSAPGTPPGRRKDKPVPFVSRIRGFFRGRLGRMQSKPEDGSDGGGDIVGSAGVPESDSESTEDKALENELTKVSFGMSIKKPPTTAEHREVAFQMRKLRQQSTRKRCKPAGVSRSPGTTVV